ncbi:charged multivesicular body protein 4c-like [Acipenser ruthenus]|uniref:charged multivesicular body protein 4c-like n=1 Tax=Acipenser ruthenus TaxID=7906 RepID=UPI00145BA6C3|nr:charged multivesicular body protein 4c-like [Acipenser ruthenus]
MSGFAKLFGKGKGSTGKGPTPQEAIQKLRDTETILVRKQEFLEDKIHKELLTAKKNGTKNKRAALQALKRKKARDGTLSTIEYQREALENTSTNTEVLKTMSEAALAMKRAHNDM